MATAGVSGKKLLGMNGARAAPDPVLSDVVRQRLATLLAEVPARRLLAEPGWDETADPPAERAGRASVPPRVEARATPGEGPRPTRGQGPLDQSRPEPPVAIARLGAAGRAAWEFSRSHLMAVAIVVLTGCLWGGFNVLQARSTPVVPAVTPSVLATPSPTPSAVPTVLVHVLGEVRHPGVVELHEGSRVKDAIAAAGGLTAKAVPGELNLAAVVADGSQLVIGNKRSSGSEVRPAGTSGTGTGSGGDKVSLNTASQAQLEELPGVGPVTAQRIIAWRAEHDRFTRIEELQEVDGIGAKTFAEIAPHVRV